ncbi:MAG: hypothetical protein BHW33_02615 [Firmicutes bacterium CAG:137_57_8]|nr:MAG: hypothetical protein BHW33_02615 [Firmicutes bacterium CAG:137_57_8]
MPKNQIYYWQVPMPEWDFPVRITERTNQKIDITTSDWSLHWHESLEFQLILQGAITLSCNGQTETLHPGDVFFANWCIPHHAVGFADGTHYYVLQVDPAWLLVEEDDLRLSRYRDILTVHSPAFECFVRQDTHMSSILLQIISAYKARQFGWEIQIKGLFLSLLSLFFGSYCHLIGSPSGILQYDSSLRYTRKVLTYVANHYADAISLDHIAAEIGLTKSYLCRLFRQHTGSSIMSYVNRLRCYQAIYLMETGSSVTQAALVSEDLKF